MPDIIIDSQRKLAKAYFEQIEWVDDRPQVKSDGVSFVVQFNPASLRVSYSNQVQTGDQGQGAATQYVGRGSTKMSVELVLDVSMPIRTSKEDAGADSDGTSGTDTYVDVRAMTEKLNMFIRPEETENSEGETKYVPPGVRFVWGRFLFEGIMESMEETLELWSEEGVPLRASVSVSLSQQGINFAPGDQSKADPGQAGTTPFSPAQAGDNLQSMGGDKWKNIAAANGIENPRNLSAGALINMSASASAQAGFSAGVSGGVSGSFGVSAGASASAGFSASGSAGCGASASASSGASANFGVTASGGLSPVAAASAQERISFNT